MLQEAFMPEKSTYILLLSTRSSVVAVLKFAIQVHSIISSLEKDVESNVILTNIIICIYGRCNRLEWSKSLFRSLDERTVVTWNSMISICVQNGQGEQALQIFNQMRQEGVSGSTISFVSALHACSIESALQFGMQLHASIAAQKAIVDVYLNTALMSMYAKCACIEKTERLFEEMPDRNVVSWNTMISAYAVHGQGKFVVELFDQLLKVATMPTIATFLSTVSAFSNHVDLHKAKQIHALVMGEIFDSNISIGTVLVNMYRKCGCLSSAQRVFDAMKDRDQGSWNAMVATFVELNKGEEIFQLFAHMQLQGFLPNMTTYSSIISACSYETSLFEGKRLHALVINSGFQKDLLVGNALVSMYNKCGSLDKAQRVFDNMDEHNTVSWNAILDAHALHGKSHDIFNLFEQMQKDEVVPDKMTFTSMLSACSRLGLVDEVQQFLISMIKDFSLIPTPDHFNCVIDLLARLGKLDEAEALLNNMPVPYSAVSMRTLLGACRSQTDLERGERTANQVMLLDPMSTSPYTILFGLYGVNCEEGGESEGAGVPKHVSALLC
ncbi:hypothetical protein KP509_32G014100 [Ceratopteris richardii]|nr:hypothetical protein KP509_32G014100 [Ceratopteris richardii]